MDKIEFSEKMKSKTKRFALDIIKLVSELPNRREAWAISQQLIRAATSVGANYRAATRARSKAEFFSKISIVIEEADESLYWLELLTDSQMMASEKISRLYCDGEEILKILSTARKNIIK
jgi:four helix bundle protein